MDSNVARESYMESKQVNVAVSTTLFYDIIVHYCLMLLLATIY
jgi:hypothetical protein